ncbi:phage tail fiber protein [Rhodoligotrophos defluvii]|uniref:phage tail fiber protein n=1 Tax=Rhodoligotrophos defluvii TaxID=2561934 RepID=UPI0010C96EB5|nr:hypothetical protein [Rhodoligotrophos defluvii]
MAAISNYLGNKFLDHALGVASYTMPTTVYLALYTTNPTAANSGTEVSGNGYSRQACAFNAASGLTTANTAQENFTASGGAFGTVTHWGILDAATTGNLLFFGQWTNAKTINDGDTFRVEAGELDISVS